MVWTKLATKFENFFRNTRSYILTVSTINDEMVLFSTLIEFAILYQQNRWKSTPQEAGGVYQTSPRSLWFPAGLPWEVRLRTPTPKGRKARRNQYQSASLQGYLVVPTWQQTAGLSQERSLRDPAEGLWRFLRLHPFHITHCTFPSGNTKAPYGVNRLLRRWPVCPVARCTSATRKPHCTLEGHLFF